MIQNYTHILVLLLRLRQACNHPYLAVKGQMLLGNVENKTTKVKTRAGNKLSEEAKSDGDKQKTTAETNTKDKQVEKSTGDGPKKEGGATVCPVCQDVLEDPMVSSCKHVFCKSCVKSKKSDDEPKSDAATNNNTNQVKAEKTSNFICPVCDSDLVRYLFLPFFRF